MRIFNRTKNTAVFDDVVILQTVREKIDGMLAFKTVRPIYFETRWGVHTFGMKVSIDIAVLNENGIVVVLKKEVRPNKFFFWNPKYKRVLEFPFTDAISVGDVLEFSV